MQERQYLKNVTPKTLAWYRDSFKSFTGCETESQYKARIVELRQRGVKGVAVSTWCRCITAYLTWKSAGFKPPRLKEEQNVLATFTTEQVKRLLAFKPKGQNQKRC